MAKDVVSTAVGDSGKGLFFLILACSCLWLILDLIYGRKILYNLASSLFEGGGTDSADQYKDETGKIDGEKYKEKQEEIKKKAEKGNEKEAVKDLAQLTEDKIKNHWGW